MNEAPAESSATPLAGWVRKSPDHSEGWSWQRWLVCIMLVFVAQVALVFIFGQKHFPPTRPMGNVPHLTLADSSSELIALNDPTLFALPHPDDFATPFWSRIPVVNQPSFRWTEQPQPLPLDSGKLGAVFTLFMRTNQFAQTPLNFKPPLKLSEPVLGIQPVFAANSTLRASGDLAGRKMLSDVSLPSWPYADVIYPSRVQVLVDPSGEVVSAVLLMSDSSEKAAGHYDVADQRALEIARTLRFAPAPELTIGQLIFDWRTVPPPATNSPAASQ
jgi:hypothetical protein